MEKKEITEHSLAYEMLQDSKKKSKRDFIEKIVLIFALFLSNIIWISYINQLDFVGETTTVESGNGIATYLENSESGDINYGND